MLINLTQDFGLPASQKEAWKLLRETERFAALIPGVKTISRVSEASEACPAKEGDEKYQVHIEQTVGPFRFGMNLYIKVSEVVEPTLLRAEISGVDGKNRVKGTLTGRLVSAEPSGSNLEFACSVEVLGALAALGAPAIRRKSNDIFAEFTENVRNYFEAKQPAIVRRNWAGRIARLTIEWLARRWCFIRKLLQ